MKPRTQNGSASSYGTHSGGNQHAPPPPPRPWGLIPTPVSPLCRPPYSSCRTPQSKRELLGVRYAVQGVDGCESTDELAPPDHPQGPPLRELPPPANPQLAPMDELPPLDKQVPSEQPPGATRNELVPPRHPQVCSIGGPTLVMTAQTGLR